MLFDGLSERGREVEGAVGGNGMVMRLDGEIKRDFCSHTLATQARRRTTELRWRKKEEEEEEKANSESSELCMHTAKVSLKDPKANLCAPGIVVAVALAPAVAK